MNQENRKKINISKTDLELEDIITAKIPRKLFQYFLHNRPLCNHSYEIEILDRFICSVAKYSRKPINWENLEEYLRKKEVWSEPNVSGWISRVKTGLEIIRVYRKYRSYQYMTESVE